MACRNGSLAASYERLNFVLRQRFQAIWRGIDAANQHLFIALGQRYRRLCEVVPSLRVLGGCCGTDHRHIAAIRDACVVRTA